MKNLKLSIFIILTSIFFTACFASRQAATPKNFRESPHTLRIKNVHENTNGMGVRHADGQAVRSQIIRSNSSGSRNAKKTSGYRSAGKSNNQSNTANNKGVRK